ncbi:MAG: PDZ domain-containing protein [Planctomycetes bacterium]|nr:PDZ domain-containing protein [Planctomycetota bacterium]
MWSGAVTAAFLLCGCGIVLPYGRPVSTLPPFEGETFRGGEGGVLIRSVGPDLEEEGLRPGDLIVGLDGRRVAGWSEMSRLLKELEPGSGGELSVRSEDGSVRTVVTGTLPASRVLGMEFFTGPLYALATPPGLSAGDRVGLLPLLNIGVGPDEVGCTILYFVGWERRRENWMLCLGPVFITGGVHSQDDRRDLHSHHLEW